MDAALQKEKCGDDINERIGTNIDLQDKKKHHLRQIVRLPLPRIGRDAIVGFVEEQIHDGQGGSTLPFDEHEELREMLRQLSSDNTPEPQITMKYEMLRLCTLKTFPGQDRPFAIRITGAGFYYAGHLDQVICYCCGNRKDKWVPGDIPLLIHQNMAPYCGFLTHNAVVNVPIRKANSTESPSSAEVRLLTIQRSEGSNQSDKAQGEVSLILPSSEQNQISNSNIPHQMLVTKNHSQSNLLVDLGGQNVLENLQIVSADVYSVEEPQPNYPQHVVKKMRINSFQGWPIELRQKPEEMTDLGLNYASSSNNSTANSMASKDMTGSTRVTDGNVTGASAFSPSPGKTEIQKYLLTDSAQSVLDMGYQPKLVLRAIERVLWKRGTEELNGQIIMEAVFELEEENKVQPQGSVRFAEGYESNGKGSEAAENETSRELKIDPEKIKRNYRELLDATLCIICLENTISVAFLPCGHYVTCPDCAPAMRNCPICRALIAGTVKTSHD